MSASGVDVERLPEMKISQETFDALAEINGEEFPPVVNGATWKRRHDCEDGRYAFVICRYRTHKIGGAITIEMLRPVVTGSVRLDPAAPGFDPRHYSRKKR